VIHKRGDIFFLLFLPMHIINLWFWKSTCAIVRVIHYKYSQIYIMRNLKEIHYIKVMFDYWNCKHWHSIIVQIITDNPDSDSIQFNSHVFASHNTHHFKAALQKMHNYNLDWSVIRGNCLSCVFTNLHIQITQLAKNAINNDSDALLHASHKACSYSALGVLSAMWWTLSVPRLCASLPRRSSSDPRWVPVLPDVCPAAGWSLQWGVPVWQ